MIASSNIRAAAPRAGHDMIRCDSLDAELDSIVTNRLFHALHGARSVAGCINDKALCALPLR